MSVLRIDAAGYQTKIIEYCDTEGIEYAIAAKAVRTGRQLLVKMRENHRKFLEHSAAGTEYV